MRRRYIVYVRGSSHVPTHFNIKGFPKKGFEFPSDVGAPEAETTATPSATVAPTAAVTAVATAAAAVAAAAAAAAAMANELLRPSASSGAIGTAEGGMQGQGGEASASSLPSALSSAAGSKSPVEGEGEERMVDMMELEGTEQAEGREQVDRVMVDRAGMRADGMDEDDNEDEDEEEDEDGEEEEEEEEEEVDEVDEEGEEEEGGSSRAPVPDSDSGSATTAVDIRPTDYDEAILGNATVFM